MPARQCEQVRKQERRHVLAAMLLVLLGGSLASAEGPRVTRFALKNGIRMVGVIL